MPTVAEHLFQVRKEYMEKCGFTEEYLQAEIDKKNPRMLLLITAWVHIAQIRHDLEVS
jgi:hypothetical protein